MLILCCGPDSFRALARAKELEAAFRQKHDPQGRAIERLASGKDGVDEVIEKAAGASLFSPKRFLRADGIISACPKAKQKALLEALSRDVDSMIVVSVEEEKPPATIMSVFANLPKLVLSDYPPLRGKAFFSWASEYAKTLGNTDVKTLDKLMDRYEGDSWSFANEVMKLAAGAPLEEQSRVSEPSTYDIADRFIRADASRHASLEKDFGYQEYSIILQQSIYAVRTMHGDVEGIPPFVLRKLQSFKHSEAERVIAATLEMIFLQRSGLLNEEEAVTLAP